LKQYAQQCHLRFGTYHSRAGRAHQSHTSTAAATRVYGGRLVPRHAFRPPPSCNGDKRSRYRIVRVQVGRTRRFVWERCWNSDSERGNGKSPCSSTLIAQIAPSKCRCRCRCTAYYRVSVTAGKHEWFLLNLHQLQFEIRQQRPCPAAHGVEFYRRRIWATPQ
jgi:hypothetical protein